MKLPKVRFLLLVSLLALIGAVASAFAAGSHVQAGYNDGAFNFDFKLATGPSAAATAVGLVALFSGLAGIGLHLSGGKWVGGAGAAHAGGTESPGSPDFAGVLRRLAKSRSDVWLGGVCGGLGEHTPLPSWIWRLVFLGLLCWYGTGILLYLLLWICLPESRTEKRQTGIRPETAAYPAP